MEVRRKPRSTRTRKPVSEVIGIEYWRPVCGLPFLHSNCWKPRASNFSTFNMSKLEDVPGRPPKGKCTWTSPWWSDHCRLNVMCMRKRPWRFRWPSGGWSWLPRGNCILGLRMCPGLSGGVHWSVLFCRLGQSYGFSTAWEPSRSWTCWVERQRIRKALVPHSICTLLYCSS